MTPIKQFIVVGNSIFIEDYAGLVTHCATASNLDQMNFVLHALVEIHKVPVTLSDTMLFRIGQY